MPFSEQKIGAILADPNSFNPREIRDLMIEVELSPEQKASLENYHWDIPHRKAYEEGKLLGNEPREYKHCMSGKAGFDDLKAYADKYGKFAALYETIQGHYQDVFALLQSKQEEKSQFDGL